MFREFLSFEQYYVKECKECGKCFKYCYAFKKTKYPIYKYIKPLFEQKLDEKNIKKMNKFLRSCIYCKKCEVYCINNLKLTERFPAVKYELSKLIPNYTWLPYTPPFISRFISPKRIDLFFQNLINLLITNEERQKFEEYRVPQKREVVFFSGCGIQALENQYFTLLDIFKKLNIDFGLVEGSYKGSICCGAVYSELGKVSYGKRLLNNLLDEIKKYETKTVLVYCATCYYSLTTLAPQIIDDYDLEILHATGYLAKFLKDNDKIKLLKVPRKGKKVYTIHDSCHLAHSGDISSIRNLISLLPGASIVEMKHNKHHAICDASCMIQQQASNPFSLLYKKNLIPIIDEGLEINADEICSLCPGCHAILSMLGDGLFSTLGLTKKRILVNNWVSILGQYLGIKRKDMLTHRFSHIIDVPFKNSGLWYTLKSMKAIMMGYIGKKPPK